MKKNGNPQPFKGKSQLNSSLTATNSGGLFVANRFEIDTTLCNDWTAWGQTFSRWKVKHIDFHFVPIRGSATEGIFGISVLDDPLQTTPASAQQATALRCTTNGHVYDKLKLRFKPVRKGWMYTRDVTGTTDDRLEMPGDVVFWSENCSATFVPGIAWMEYSIEFDGVTNANVAPRRSLANSMSSTTPSVSSESDTERELQKAKYIAEVTQLRAKYSSLFGEIKG